MMHGRFDMPGANNAGGSTGLRGLVDPLLRHKWIPFIILPTLLAAVYYLFIAANQYESEAHFLVRSAQGSASSPAGGFGQALSLMSGGGLSVSPDTASVSDYLSSHDAVQALRARAGLVDSYRRPEADFLSKLRPADPSPERLLAYFRRHADVKLDENGITTIKVRTFRPEDSYRLVNALMALGEERVNTLNRRAYASTLGLARDQLAEAEAALGSSQAALTAFRQGRRNIDPLATSEAQIGVVSALRGAVAQARAQRAALGSLSSASPQARALDARVAALSGQVAAEANRLTGGSKAIAADMGDYQSLVLRQQFASKRYEDAAAALQQARVQAIRQQLFVVRVVEPNVPVKALYPKGLKFVLTLFVTLVLIYSLGWLIAAGVREHAA